MSSENLHEPSEALSQETVERHRGVVSLIEELEAVDWYQQRAEATSDGQLKRVLLHHRDEEIEHAVMILEWLRRRDPRIDAMCRTYLFTEADIVEVEKQAEAKVDGGAGAPERARSEGALGIGSLKTTHEEAAT